MGKGLGIAFNGEGMEIKTRDLAGRIGLLDTGKRRVETPLLLPVINPKKLIIPPSEMKKAGIEGIITNSYIIWKNKDLRERALKLGIHKFLDFDGLVMTDSGAFQLMQYGDIGISNEEILSFQRDIGVDIGVILDIPGLGNKQKMKENLSRTMERAKDAIQRFGNDFLIAGPIQGGLFKGLRQKSAKALIKLGYRYLATGSIVPLLNKYRFKDAFDILVWTRQTVPWDTAVHFFGAGHPMMLSFAVSLGADVFDSAAYALFAEEGKYLTVDGTKDIRDMKETPCSCKVCSEYSVSEIREDKRLLARHNLYATIAEIKNIKENIRQGTLWELLEKRARSHPNLYQAFRQFSRYNKYLEEKDRISRRRFFYLSNESKNRPEVFRHKRRMKGDVETKGFVNLFPFGEVPIEVKGMYPFGQRQIPGGEAKTEEERNGGETDEFGIKDIDVVNGILGYLYGDYNLVPRNARIERSKTGRIRNVYLGNRLLLVLRAEDYMPILHGIAEEIAERGGWLVEVDPSVSSFVKEGKSVFAKFVVNADKRIRPGMEIVVVDNERNVLATGTAMMSGKEMIECREGIAVKTRKLKLKG